MKKAAEFEEKRRMVEIDEEYRQRLFNINLSVVDIAARNDAIRQLDAWRTDQYLRAWVEQAVKVHAAKVKSGMYEKSK